MLHFRNVEEGLPPAVVMVQDAKNPDVVLSEPWVPFSRVENSWEHLKGDPRPQELWTYYLRTLLVSPEEADSKETLQASVRKAARQKVQGVPVIRFADLGSVEEDGDPALGANNSEDSESYEEVGSQPQDMQQGSQAAPEGRMKMMLNILEQRLKGLTVELSKIQMRIGKEAIGDFAGMASILVLKYN